MTPAERWLATLWPLVRDRLPAPPARVVDFGCGPLGGFVPMRGAHGRPRRGVRHTHPGGGGHRLRTRESRSRRVARLGRGRELPRVDAIEDGRRIGRPCLAVLRT